jgi:hypothetical protein
VTEEPAKQARLQQEALYLKEKKSVVNKRVREVMMPPFFFLAENHLYELQLKEKVLFLR